MKDTIDKNRKILVMGILNATPDSFYAASRFNMTILESGADIIDIGACSTRPGSIPPDMEEEWRRLEPVLKTVRKEHPTQKLSIDSFRSEIFRRAFDLIGPFIANDVSAGDNDPEMLATVARLGLEYIPMHHSPADDASDICRFYDAFALRANESGISDWIVDPGFGFGKTVEQNNAVLRTLSVLRETGKSILVGLSRKSMLWKPLGLTPETVLDATRQANLCALRNGADIIRVHDVREAFETIEIYREETE